MIDREAVPPPDSWTIHGRIADASNATLLVEVSARLRVYKPMTGETPLWDFPRDTLGQREVAVAAIDELLGWGLVPPTAWSDGPQGPGMLQRWIDHDPDNCPVALFPAESVSEGWIAVASGHAADGRPLVLAHEDSEQLRRVAVFDAVINNADRKGGHLLRDADGRTWGIDHGICLHEEPKLRTVLWGFAEQRIPAGILTDLADLARRLPDLDLGAGISSQEHRALAGRIEQLLATCVFPQPRQGGPTLPWPPI